MRTLKAGTLIEVIVASVIFLTVFAISLHTLTRLTVDPREGELFTEADYRLKCCFLEFAGGRQADGRYVRHYDWGKIVIIAVPYRDYVELQQITLSTRVNNKPIEYTHIVRRHE